MIHESGNRILERMEQKFGKLAIPGLIRWIAVFQAAVWLIHWMSPGIIESLNINFAAVLGGEVWRVISWVFIPVSVGRQMGFIAVLFTTFIYFLISDSLEREWGVFRTNVFVIASIVCMSATTIIFAGAGLFFSKFLFMLMFMVFATLFPDYTLNLMGVIPVKARWLGFADLAFIIAMVLQFPIAIIYVGAGFIPYFLVFAPSFLKNSKARAESKIRKAKFERETRPESDAFHNCDSCGKTDVSDPDLDFRVTAEGEELCENCLPQKAEETNGG